MGKKNKGAIKYYKGTLPRVRPTTVRRRPAVPADVPLRGPIRIYEDSADSDRLHITQQVIRHPAAVKDSRTVLQDSRYEALLHCIYDAVIIAGPDGTILEVNSRAVHNFHWDKDELCGMNLIDLISGADERLLAVLRQNVSAERYSKLEAICVREDGSRFNAEIVVNAFSRDGGQGSLCAFVRDITARKQAESDLQDAHERLLDAEKVQARMDTIATLFHELSDPLQVLMSTAEIEEQGEHVDQLSQIMDVLEQLRQHGPLERVLNEEGAA